MKIYLDNAATSYPKPTCVIKAMEDYFYNIGVNTGRGGYENSIKGSRLLYDSRENVCSLFNFDKPSNVIFTQNVTASLNIILKSVIKDSWSVITTSMEHNSVLRPLKALENSRNIKLNVLYCEENGKLSIEKLKNFINKDTKLLVISISSNVVGTIQQVEEIGQICKDNNILFILDAAQGAGYLDIDFKRMNLSALAFTGHKGLLGPQGTGGFIISDELNDLASTYMEGGTGSFSESISHPLILPDKFEAGTLNTLGIAGLNAAINFIKSVGIRNIREKEEYLSEIFLQDLLNIDELIVYGPKNAESITPVFSVGCNKIDPSELCFILDSEYKIMTRCGLHCAPLAHKTIGSFPSGTVRFSIGYFNDINDIKSAVTALNNIIKGCD
jgi:cysteine desulfurase family protein